MTTTLIGYARCSTDKQDLAAQRAALEKLGVAPKRIYTDRGLTGATRARRGLGPGLSCGARRRHARGPEARSPGTLSPGRSHHRRRPRGARRQARARVERL